MLAISVIGSLRGAVPSPRVIASPFGVKQSPRNRRLLRRGERLLVMTQTQAGRQMYALYELTEEENKVVKEDPRMVKQKKVKGTLVNVKELSNKELDKAIDEALDALLGPEEEEDAEEEKPEEKKPSAKKQAKSVLRNK